ncbi:hypothetical protein FisN_12Lh299 [Fistulifera solaris]|uniref:Uncharacterized protein n=1 Tax=Fistulifera solaris TaxID=1519565 RepID=A0A1Z5JLW1_FISSO|nr:hypothetical protein FisN_12Lh299 [Fistulifera solaris]|eukprot:GAX15005.1 hypothetical protein FisN_12Lh299 [Fistulifera solaris]
MGLFTTLFGGSLGFAAQAYSNSIRKVPISRQPWNHLGMFILGCYAGAKYPKWEETLVNDINAMRSERGLSPMVGSNKWIKYSLPEEEPGQIVETSETSP